MVDAILRRKEYELIDYFAVTCGLRLSCSLLPLFEPFPGSAIWARLDTLGC